jgi:hypothetical protein
VTEEAAVVHMPFFEKFKELQVKLPSKTLCTWTNDFSMDGHGMHGMASMHFCQQFVLSHFSLR